MPLNINIGNLLSHWKKKNNTPQSVMLTRPYTLLNQLEQQTAGYLFAEVWLQLLICDRARKNHRYTAKIPNFVLPISRKLWIYEPSPCLNSVPRRQRAKFHKNLSVLVRIRERVNVTSFMWFRGKSHGAARSGEKRPTSANTARPGLFLTLQRFLPRARDQQSLPEGE